MTSRLRNRLSDGPDDRGAVLIFVALLLVVLIGLGAFAVDVGFGYAVKRQQSVTADAAALAGAQAAGTRFRQLYPAAGVACTSGTAGQVSAEATTAAIATYNANAPQGSSGNPTVTVACESGNFNVTVSGQSTIPTILGGVLGQSELRPRAQATAQVSGAPAYGGLRPYAICIDDTVGATESVTVQSEFGEDNHSPIQACNGNPPGNWGLVDFNGGSNPTGDIADWTENGYPGPISFPSSLPGDPGANFNSSLIRNALTTLVGDTVLFPVATKWTQSGGNNASFTAVGAMAVKVCGYAVIGKTPVTDPTCWNSALHQDVVTNRPGVDLVIQWQYRGFTTSYDPGGSTSASCNLSSQFCVPTIRLWR